MPADRLTTVPSARLAAAVRAVLSGAEPAATAATNGVSPAELEEATQAYHAAGLAALERRAGTEWYQMFIEFPQASTAEKVGATRLGPRLEELQEHGAVTGWWFLRKPPGWRLRLHRADTSLVGHLLDELAAAGEVTRWWPGIYEPERYAFGGPDGIGIVHDLFCADSRAVLDYARRHPPGLGRRELSLVLIGALLRGAGLDWFEIGDVFARVAQIRPIPPGVDIERAEKLAVNVGTLLRVAVHAGNSLFAPGGPVAFAAPWLAEFQTAGRRLAEAAAKGRLDRGLRAILIHVLIFHWNGFGLSAAGQGILARAAQAAILPRS